MPFDVLLSFEYQLLGINRESVELSLIRSRPTTRRRQGRIIAGLIAFIARLVAFFRIVAFRLIIAEVAPSRGRGLKLPEGERAGVDAASPPHGGAD